MADDKVQIKLTGRRGDSARLPAVLVPAARAVQPQADDVFLPAAYLEPTRTIDVGASARSAGDGVADQLHGLAADEVVVLELADGSVLITSAERLRATLAQTRPELLGPDGAVLLEKLRAEGAAPGRGLGEAVGGLISKVFTLVAGRVVDGIVTDALAQLERRADLGVSWAGTRALMGAIEKRLDREPGLYRWLGASGTATDFKAPAFSPAALAEPALYPMLVFVHGTASSTLGSFGDLRTGDRDLWTALERQFSGGIFAFEHRTLSDSPIDNALQLAQALPPGAELCLVSHSRGGLVADLMCLGDFDALIDGYSFSFEGTGDADPAEARRVRDELEIAHAEHRRKLRELAALLREKKPVVRRYVRAASPANGTKLASGNFDVFLSGLLTLIGQVPFFFGSPFYSAFKRVVIEIARNRTNPHLVPGIEAMLPDSPMAQLLRDAPVRPGTQMAVIAGDIQGGNMLRRLGVLLTDFLLFDNEDNDLVVNTAAMLAGIAPKADSRVLFDRGSDVSHFRYFSNADTRAALRDWLVSPDPRGLAAFRALPAPGEFAAALEASASRDAVSVHLPIVVVLPGVMGSHLEVASKDKVWFDPLDIAAGGLSKIEWGKPGVEAGELFAMFYGHLCQYLAGSHRVERFAYDWRQPLDILAERLGQFLDRLMKETDKPIRLLAHSMGGLVVRATIHKRRAVMDALMQRDGARIVMLGTPNQGAHSMVENLLGKGDTLRTLVRLDARHTMQEVLDIVAGFRGALSLLPKPGFRDMFQGQPDGGGFYAFQQAGTWADFVPKVADFWFGNGRVGLPDQATLDAAAWLWRQDDLAGQGQPEGARPRLPAEYEKKSVYVFGVARNTPCGVREENGRLKMVGTTRGDGTVTWESGRIGGIGSFYYMPAEHGDLPSTKEYFPAVTELLTSGATAKLAQQAPAVRAIEQPEPLSYDAGPPTADDPDALERGLMGGSLRNRVPPRPRRRLEVAVKAMDLRFLSEPILVGTYEQDPIAGPQGLIDRELLAGDLSERHTLGLYAGPRGTATVVLRVPSEVERRRGTLSGAVVTGLGQYEGALSLADLTEAVRTGALRYLLQVIDVLGKAEREVTLASLLLGYNSSANLSVDASVEALVRGVMEANAKFYETTRLNIRIARLDIVELYLDTAISAAYALRHLTPRLAAQATKQGTLLICRGELERGEGVRQRLFDARGSSYWPRLIVTDADRSDEQCTPDCYAPGGGCDALSGAAPRTQIADRLRFLYVGQRARAESVVQQRQPGLIEKLVRQQIHDKAWKPDFGRMLFQLMVPHDFKDSARQFDRVVLVVDSTTANLPWELMLADDPSRADDDKRPLALRTALVRQLSSSRFRRRVRQNMERTALVVGNPSVQGFATAFAGVAGVVGDPPDLPGAQAEAEAAVNVLGSMGYTVERVIGNGVAASDVLAALYRRPWRMLHIAAHGIFNLRHVDGRLRSGVVLSDGLLITAAEIEAMELVPELVFLNCCHLGQIDIGRDGNKLAASVARELIDIGVRCVVVAGWAVNDELARLFGQTLYAQLLLRRRSFGEAVFAARRAVWEENGEDITWGAFQAYGDPGWLAEPRADGSDDGRSDSMFVSPDEILDELARIRADLARQRDRLSEREIRAQADAIESCLLRRCPPGWRGLPQLQSALGATWRDLGEWEKAREAFLAAIQADDRVGQVPMRDIEQLAKVEAFLGEQRAVAEMNVPAGQPVVFAETGDELLSLALRRLKGLDQLVSESSMVEAGAPAELVPSVARAALRGSVFKRRASMQARRLLRGEADPKKQHALSRAMMQALEDAIAAYSSAEGHPGGSRFSPYLALNRLSLEALTDWPDPMSKDAATALAQQCRQRAEQGFARSPNLWDAVMQADALLVEHLLDGKLGTEGEAGHATFDELARAYDQVLCNITVKATQIDAIATQMELMSRLCDAVALIQHDDPTLALMADRLVALMQRFQPGRAPRDDRPPRVPPAPPVAAKAPAKAAARKRTATKAPAKKAVAKTATKAVGKKR